MKKGKKEIKEEKKKFCLEIGNETKSYQGKKNWKKGKKKGKKSVVLEVQKQ